MARTRTVQKIKISMSNIAVDAVPLRQILPKCKIKQVYEVMCAKWTRNFWCKNILTLHRYRDFHVRVFQFESPCIH